MSFSSTCAPEVGESVSHLTSQPCKFVGPPGEGAEPRRNRAFGAARVECLRNVLRKFLGFQVEMSSGPLIWNPLAFSIQDLPEESPVALS